MADSAVEIERLVKAYGGKHRTLALKGVDLTVEEGELLVLLGPSGCGKSTMLRCIAGLERATEGRIAFHGEAVSDAATGLHKPPDRRDIGLVFQSYVLWPHMTVRQNVEYPLKARRHARELRGSRVQEVLELVHCEHLADRYPAQLSGGQQQRVALARALAARPQVLLLDEPLSNLDALLRVNLRSQLHEIHRTVGYTGIYVTHDQAEALSLGDRIAVMQEGEIAQIATPRDLFERPANEYVAHFLGIRNVLPMTAALDGKLSVVTAGRTAATSLSVSPPVGTGKYSAYFRPESIAVAHRAVGVRALPIDGLVLGEGVVTEAMYAGSEIDAVIDVGGRQVYARLRADQGFTAGSPVQAAVARADVLLYDDARNLIDAGNSRRVDPRQEPDDRKEHDAHHE